MQYLCPDRCMHLCLHMPLCACKSHMQHDWRVVFLKAIACGYQGHWQGSSGIKWLINYAWLVGLNKQCNERWDEFTKELSPSCMETFSVILLFLLLLLLWTLSILRPRFHHLNVSFQSYNYYTISNCIKFKTWHHFRYVAKSDGWNYWKTEYFLY